MLIEALEWLVPCIGMVCVVGGVTVALVAVSVKIATLLVGEE